MKVIEATWEKRNLGVDTIEIQFDKSDSLLKEEELINNIEVAIKDYGSHYIVVKIPSGNSLLLNTLQNMNFRYIESQLELKYSNKDVNDVLNKVNHMFVGVDCIKIEDDFTLEKLKSKIQEGIFDTDRISSDECFGIKIANDRYSNWVEDEYKRGTGVYIVTHMGEEIGFFVTRGISENTQYGILGGLFSEYKNKGLGFAWNYMNIKESFRNNAKVFKTFVSSNNVEVLKIHEFFGSKIDNINYVFIKHI